MANEQTIPLGRGGKYGQMTVDTDRFQPHVMAHVFTYGLRQILNDAIADKTDDDGKPLPVEDLVAKATKRLETLYSGELRSRADAAEPVDPVMAECYRLVKPVLQAAAKKAPEWAQCPKDEKDKALWVLTTRAKGRGEAFATWDDFIQPRITPDIRKQAERRVKEAEAAKAAVGDI